jgi:acyl-coenzyme A thioesterase PaaI-like protein
MVVRSCSTRSVPPTGGTFAALVDHVLGAVLDPLIPRGAWAATTEFKLNLLAPIHE